ncbi:MAG: DUF4331 family protein [Ilumatobacter sp.]
MKKAAFATLGLAGLVVGASAVGMGASAADHLDAPKAASNPSLDINDVYAFQSPQDPDNTVLVMTVNPLAGILSPTEFDENGAYRFLIDNDGDAKEDVFIPISFEDRNNDGTQEMRVHGWGTDDVGEAFGLRNGGTAWAGLADDPFFFDLAGFQNGLAFTGDDTLAGTNVTAIVLELPSSFLTDGDDPNIGVWATTATRQGGGGRVDQMGRPGISTVLVPSSLKDAFNRTPPQDQFEKYGATITESLLGLNGDQAYSEAVASILLPDILTVDVSQPASYLNGRALADDVIDISLTVVSNGGLTTDGVDANDKAFSDTFPYLAAPHS